MPLGIWMHSVEINDGSIRCGCTCYLHRPQSCLRRTLRRCLVKAPSAFSHPTHLSAQAKQSGAIEFQLSSVSAQMVSHGFTVVLPWCHLKDLKAGSALVASDSSSGSWPIIPIVQLPDFLRRHWARRIPLAETSGKLHADSCVATSPLVMCFIVSATFGQKYSNVSSTHFTHIHFQMAMQEGSGRSADIEFSFGYLMCCNGSTKNAQHEQNETSI